jgi:hypothetical protein
MAAAADGVQRGQHAAIEASSMMAKNALAAGAQSANVPHPPKKRWGARYRWYGKNSTYEHQTVVFLWGAPPYWTEFGTRRVVIGKKGKLGPYKIPRFKPRGPKTSVKIGNDIRRSVEHPGSRARPFFDGVKRRVFAASKPVFRNRLANEWVRNVSGSSRGR